MRTLSGISFALNLGLISAFSVIFVARHQTVALPGPILSEGKPALDDASFAVPQSPQTVTQPFRWRDLNSSNGYSGFIANLRAVGCPEASIEDIVRGNVERAFSWERGQLHLDGSGNGPWSRNQEQQLVAALLSVQSAAGTTSPASGRPAQSMSVALGPTVPANTSNSGSVAQASASSQSLGAVRPGYPLFLQNVNWTALGFTPEQQAAIAQVRQQFQNQTANLDPNSGAASENLDTVNPNNTGSTPNLSSGSAAASTQWQQAVQDANKQLSDSLGIQAYEVYAQQEYYAWYQPQVIAATATRTPLYINPDAFSPK